MGRPVPTSRALWVAALSLVPAVLAMLSPRVAPLLAIFDGALITLVLIDYFSSPSSKSIEVRRITEPVWSAGRANVVTLELTLAVGVTRALRGEIRDWLTPGPIVEAMRQTFDVHGLTRVVWKATPLTRGPVTLGPVTVRLLGPLGLCARQFKIDLSETVKVFPDLAVLSHDELTLARAQDEQAKRPIKVRSEGREFESLREYRRGDDRRSIDWKATARRGRAMVRQHQPERNQQVILLLDCGRHMAGEIEGRRKLDHAVDAALRLARVALDQGDVVGVGAYGATMKAWLPPRKGLEHLASIAQTLSTVQASLEESDVGLAIDRAFSRGARRSMVIVLTDLLDPDAASALIRRTRSLVPRHLPMIVSLQDSKLHAAATLVPSTTNEAFERVAAVRLERDGAATVARLREGGARVVRGPPSSFAGASVNAYLDVKARGLL
ncbi:MAG: DUF58 domain-containing protein [Archangium sp.]|nr:DUF58 domain-containing protein [Archangium sp.]